MEILLGIFGHAVIVLVYIGIMAVDITLFFLLAHFLAINWPRPLFSSFAKVGNPIIEPLIDATQRIRGVSHRASFFWISLALCLCKVFLTFLGQTMFRSAAIYVSF